MHWRVRRKSELKSARRTTRFCGLINNNAMLLLLIIVFLSSCGSPTSPTSMCVAGFTAVRNANIKFCRPSIIQPSSSSPLPLLLRRKDTPLWASSTTAASSSDLTGGNVRGDPEQQQQQQNDTSSSSDNIDNANAITTTNNDIQLTSLSTTTTTTESAEPESSESVVPFPVVLWRFTRPHTLIGSALAIPALHLLAAPSLLSACTNSWRMMTYSMIYAMVPSLLMNLYITGLNQITDVEIDKINKPDLPIAAGILSKKNAIITVVVSLAVSLGMGHFCPAPYSTPGLKFALWGSCILGTLYSWPKSIRLKRFPLLAAFCIVAVRGTIINASFFAHAKAAVFGGPASVLNALMTDPKCYLSSFFFCIFGIVIALMKDVPDVKGDLTSNVRTFSVRLGQRQVFTMARRLLSGLFVGFSAGFARGAFLAYPTSISLTACRGLIALASLFAGYTIRQKSQQVDPTDSSQVYSFYMYLWKLFYLSYFALPFAR